MSEKVPKSLTNFVCEYCDYNTSRKSQYHRHLHTPKHKNNIMETNIKNMETKKSSACTFMCQSIDCGKMYTTRNGLWKHIKKCKTEISCTNSDTATDIDKYCITQDEYVEKYQQSELVIQLLQENKEIKSMLIELAAKPSIINNNYNGNNNNNNNKQQFNLNFFLNETCKDAMNIDEFINTLVITDAELEDFGKLGYVQGISNILIRGLKELGEHHRPIHNTDRKRNVLYMKYKEGWEKEVDEPLVFKNYLPTEIPKMTVRRMIYRVSKKGFFGMNTWKQNNPTHSDITTKKHEEYMVLLHQLMCGHEPPDLDISKIVKIVSEKTLFITKR